MQREVLERHEWPFTMHCVTRSCHGGKPGTASRSHAGQRLSRAAPEHSFPGGRCHRQGLARVVQCSAIVASLVCLLVVLFQLNGRIAADPAPLIQGDVAPFEWAGETLSSRCTDRA